MRRWVVVMGLALVFGASPACAGGPEGEAAQVILKAGDTAPEFSFAKVGDGAGEQETTAKLSDYRGRNVLLAFYPKAFTPGCTKQMCGYRDDFATLSDSNTVVIAVSADNQADSDRFKKEYNLPFPVVGDPEMKIVRAYGVPSMKVGEHDAAKRTVFLIDTEGVIRYIDLAYDVEKGKAPLFERMEELKKAKSQAKE